MASTVRQKRNMGENAFCDSVISAAIRNKVKMLGTKYPHNDDKELQSKIDHEITMRDGINKLLAASQLNSKQALGASKNLVTCNARIMTWMSMMQKQHEVNANQHIEQESISSNDSDRSVQPCKSRISLSDLQIPLQWKNSEDNDDVNKENREDQFYSLFCVFKLGSEVLDTGLIYNIDQALKIVEFDDVITFDTQVDHNFLLEIQVYCAVSLHENTANKNQPSKSNRRKLGKLDKDDANAHLSSNLHKYYVIGHAYLNQSNATGESQTHVLYEGAPAGFSASSTSQSAPANLPKAGAFSCQLFAKPACSDSEVINGFINIQLTVEGMPAWVRFWCCLRQVYIHGWMFAEDNEKDLPPKITLELTKDTTIERAPRLRMRRINSLLLSNVQSNGKLEEIFLSGESKEDRKKWMDGIGQSIANIKAWGNNCKSTDTLIKPTRQSRIFKSMRSYSQVLSPSQSDVNTINMRQREAANKELKVAKDVHKTAKVRVRQFLSVEVIPEDAPNHEQMNYHREKHEDEERRINVTRNKDRNQITPRQDDKHRGHKFHGHMGSTARHHEQRSRPLCSTGTQKRQLDECLSPRQGASSAYTNRKDVNLEKRPKLAPLTGTPRRIIKAPKAAIYDLESL